MKWEFNQKVQVEAKEISSYIKCHRTGAGIIEGVKRLYWCENNLGKTFLKMLKQLICHYGKNPLVLISKCKESSCWQESTSSNPTRCNDNQGKCKPFAGRRGVCMGESHRFQQVPSPLSHWAGSGRWRCATAIELGSPGSHCYPVLCWAFRNNTLSSAGGIGCLKPPASRGSRARDQIHIPHVEFSVAESLSSAQRTVALC